ncbi:hypothetical protein [Oceaniferula spumae]
MIHKDKHPSELNSLQRYNRTVKLATKTNRLKNKDWYRDALELDVQVHCYKRDEAGMDCYLHVKSHNLYEKIGVLKPSQLEQYDELKIFVNQALSHEAAAKAKSLGIIFYLADELSIASLGPEHQNPAELDELRAKMVESPKEVLEDKTVSIESHAWRLFPYAGAAAGNEFATAVAVSRRNEDTLRALRDIGEELNLPIRTAALSAPLCAIDALPWFSRADQNGTVAVFAYKQFSLVAFFNQHFDLMLFRYMPHSNGATVPANIGPAVLATAAAFELENPVIQIIPVSGQDVDAAIVSLQSSMMNSEIILMDIGEIVRNKNLPTDVPLEMLATTQELDMEMNPLAANETFRTCLEDGWHVQDFLAPSAEELEFSPSEQDMKLLKMSRHGKVAAACILGGVVLYSGFSIWSKLTDPAWMYESKNTAGTAAALNKELQQYKHWENLLKDRSKGWVSLELITRLSPDDGSVMLTDVNHRFLNSKTSNAGKHGFQKEWIVNGLADEEGLKYITAISTRDGIKRLFLGVAKTTGNEAYLPEAEHRDVTVNLKQNNNPKFKPKSPKRIGGNLPYSFRMVITQTFGSDDNMALAGVKPTSTKK